MFQTEIRYQTQDTASVPVFDMNDNLTETIDKLEELCNIVPKMRIENGRKNLHFKFQGISYDGDDEQTAKAGAAMKILMGFRHPRNMGNDVIWDYHFPKGRPAINEPDKIKPYQFSLCTDDNPPLLAYYSEKLKLEHVRVSNINRTIEVLKLIGGSELQEKIGR